jgi:MFS family permease
VEGWRWVFYVNLPFGALALWFIVRRMPPLPPRSREGGLDGVAGALLVGGLAPFVLALQIDKRRFPWAPGLGSPGPASWAAWVTPGLLVFAAALLVAFWRRTLRSEHPILAPALFRSAVFRRANAAAFFLGATFLSILLFLPLFLVNVVGVSATRAGIGLIPLSLGVVVGSIVAGHLASALGRVRGIMLVSASLLLVGVLLLAGMDADTRFGTVTAFMVVCGLGIGPSFPLYTLAIQNAVETRRLGQATSASQFFRQIGSTVGAALMGAMLALGIAEGFRAGELPAVAVEGGVEGSLARAGAEGVVAAYRDAYAAGDRLVVEAVAGRPGAWAELEALALPGGPPGDSLRALTERAALELDATDFAAGGSPGVARLREALRGRADVGVEELRALVRETFAHALVRIFRATAVLVVIALALTARIPDHPLRRSHEDPPAA